MWSHGFLSLLLQVELLHSLVFQTLEFISDNKK